MEQHPMFPLARRIVYALPSKRHVKALQILLGERWKVNQDEPIEYGELIAHPGKYRDDPRDVYIQHEGALGLEKKVGSGATFLSRSFFVYVNDEILDLRDQSSCKWGNLEKRIRSSEILAKFQEVYNRTPE